VHVCLYVYAGNNKIDEAREGEESSDVPLLAIYLSLLLLPIPVLFCQLLSTNIAAVAATAAAVCIVSFIAPAVTEVKKTVIRRPFHRLHRRLFVLNLFYALKWRRSPFSLFM